PAHDPRKTSGFVGVVISLEDRSSSIWAWNQKGDRWEVKKVITIPAQAAEADELPPPPKGFKAAAPLVTDIDLSLGDQVHYVWCWGTGELHQYDVSDPFNPKLTGKVEIGGMVRKKGHPKSGPVPAGPQMVEISRDGRRVSFTSSLYSSVDGQFYPDQLTGWMAKADVDANGGMKLDPHFFVGDGGRRGHGG